MAGPAGAEVPSGVSGILLAAGASSRLPGPIPKQLLPIEGRPLVRLVAERALASRLDELVVVTGHRSEEVSSALAGLEVRTVHNADFAAGQSTSVRCGLEAIAPGARAAVFLMVDQPHVTSELIDRLIAAWELRGAAIVAPAASGRRGAPVLMARVMFAELASISGDVGGRQLFAGRESQIEEVEIADPGLLADIDTREELERFSDRAGTGVERSDEGGEDRS